MTRPNRIVVILGPTAGGKSDLAVALALAFNGQVINADSMQVYRHLNAGTAKPTPEQRAAVVHHLIDCVEPTEPWTVADWLGRAESIIASLHAQRLLPIVVGGTNLYLKALLEGMFDGPPADPAFRESLATIAPGELHARLVNVDPQAATRIHRNDHKRLVRALEVYHATGKPISQQQTQWAESEDRGPTSPNRPYRYDPILIGLDWPTALINGRINARVKAMFDASRGEDLISETRRLSQAGLLGEQASEALGTRQALDHLAGRCTMDEALEQTKIQTRRYAKAQRTWLKRYRDVHWLAAGQTGGSELVREAIEVVKRAIGEN